LIRYDINLFVMSYLRTIFTSVFPINCPCHRFFCRSNQSVLVPNVNLTPDHASLYHHRKSCKNGNKTPAEDYRNQINSSKIPLEQEKGILNPSISLLERAKRVKQTSCSRSETREAKLGQQWIIIPKERRKGK